MGQALFLPDSGKCLISIRNSPAVTPDNAIPQYTLVLIHQHQAMHLVSNADGSYILRIIGPGGMGLPDSLLYVVPPGIRILLRPAGMPDEDRSFRIRILCSGKGPLSGRIYHGHLYR